MPSECSDNPLVYKTFDKAGIVNLDARPRGFQYASREPFTLRFNRLDDAEYIPCGKLHPFRWVGFGATSDAVRSGQSSGAEPRREL